MTFDYAKTAATALKLLTRFGQDVTLVMATDGAYDPDLGTSTRTEATETRKAAILDFDRINFGMTLDDGSRVMASDRRCIMDANGTAPTTLDFIGIAGERYPIKALKILSPGGVPILYDMLIRR